MERKNVFEQAGACGEERKDEPESAWGGRLIAHKHRQIFGTVFNLIYLKWCHCIVGHIWLLNLSKSSPFESEATGSNPVEAPKSFFSGYFRNCLNCDSLRWSHTHFICIPAVHIISFSDTFLYYSKTDCLYNLFMPL